MRKQQRSNLRVLCWAVGGFVLLTVSGWLLSVSVQSGGDGIGGGASPSPTVIRPSPAPTMSTPPASSGSGDSGGQHGSPGGTSGGSSGGSPLDIPSAPSELSVLGVTSGSVSLAWPEVSDATRYVVYRNGQLVFPATGTSATVTDLSPSTSYSFHVRAANGAGESPESVTMAVRTLPGGGRGVDWGGWTSAVGSLLSGAAAVGTLVHAMSVHRQARSRELRPEPGSAE